MMRRPIGSAENVLQFLVDCSCILPRFVHRLDQIRSDQIRLDQIESTSRCLDFFRPPSPLPHIFGKRQKSSKNKSCSCLQLPWAALKVKLSVCWSVGRPQGFVKKLQKSSCPSVGRQVCRTRDFVKKLTYDFNFVSKIL